MHHFIRPFLKLLVVCVLPFASCTTNSKKEEVVNEIQSTQVDTTQKRKIIKEITFDRDTLTIDTKTAVFYQPDSLRIEKRKKEVGIEDFMTGADDYIYYINTSSE